MELYPTRQYGFMACSFTLPLLRGRQQRHCSRNLRRVSFSRLTAVHSVREDSGEKQDSSLRAVGLNNQVVSQFSYNQLACIRLLQDEEHNSLKIFITKAN